MSPLPQKREDMTFMNQESKKYDNTDNLYPIAYPEPVRTLFNYLIHR